jgi:hypothetical protein
MVTLRLFNGVAFVLVFLCLVVSEARCASSIRFTRTTTTVVSSLDSKFPPVARGTTKRRRTYLSQIKSVRGGASGPSKGSVPSKSTFDDITEFTSSLWIVTKLAFSKYIQPVLQDPKEKMFIPMKEAIEDPGAKFWKPINAFVQSQATQAQDLRSNYTAIETQIETVSIMLVPLRLCKVFLSAWLLAEALDYCGILEEHVGHSKLKSQVRRVWYRAQPRFTRWQTRLELLWETKATLLHPLTWSSKSKLRVALSQVPYKYHFAIGAGASLGMTMSPLVLSLGAAILQPTLILYAVSELNQQWREENDDFHLKNFTGGDNTLGATADYYLTKLRTFVRRVMQGPAKSLDRWSHGIDFGPSGAAEESEVTISRLEYLSRQMRDLKEGISDLKDGVQNADEAQVEEEHMMAMIKKGLLVGGAVGFLVGAYETKTKET